MRQLPILLAAFFLFSSLFLLEKPIDNHWFTHTHAIVEDNATTTNLLEFVSFEDANLTPAEIAIQAKIENFPSAANIRIVRVNDAKSLQQNGYLGFDFEDGDSLYQFDAFALEVNTRSENNYTWMAEIPSYEGGIIINTDSTGTSGYLHFGEQQFEIFPLRSDLSFFYEHQPFCEEFTTIDDVPVDNVGDSSTIPCEGSDCAGLTKILILLDQHTQSALEGVNIELFLSTQVEQFNYALAQSGISHRVKFVYENFFWDNRKFTLGPEEVTNLSINANANIARELNEADLVILLTDYDYPSGGNLGQATRMGQPDYGYAIASLKSLSLLVFQHELGHLFRAQHEINNHFRFKFPKPEFCDHAWELRPNLGTLMFSQVGAFGDRIRRRVLRFSDPSACYSIYRAGRIFMEDYQGNCLEYITQDYTADNTAVIQAAGCTVSQLKGNTSEYAALINGSNRLCSDPEIYTADITPEDSEATYEWFVSFDGFLPDQTDRIPIESNGNTVVIPKPVLEECSFFFLHVIVTFSTQSIRPIQAEATKRIVTTCSPFTCSFEPVDIVNR